MYENIFCKKGVDLSNFHGVTGVSLTVSLGIHFSALKRKINLTPKDIIDSKTSKQLRWQLVQLGLSFLVFMVLIVGIFGVQVYRQNISLDKLKQKASLIKKQVVSIEKKKDLINIVRKELDGRILIPEVMSDLLGLAPEGISFRKVSLNEAGLLMIQGYAVEGSNVNIFQNNLVNANAFRNVNLLFATKRKTYNMELTDFKISLELTRGEVVSDE